MRRFFFSSTVGKTSLITRFMYDSFDNTYQVILAVIVTDHVMFVWHWQMLTMLPKST